MKMKTKIKRFCRHFLKVHHHECEHDQGLRGLCRLRHDPGQAKAPLALPKAAFSRDGFVNPFKGFPAEALPETGQDGIMKRRLILIKGRDFQ